MKQFIPRDLIGTANAVDLPFQFSGGMVVLDDWISGIFNFCGHTAKGVAIMERLSTSSLCSSMYGLRSFSDPSRSASQRVTGRRLKDEACMIAQQKACRTCLEAVQCAPNGTALSCQLKRNALAADNLGVLLVLAWQMKLESVGTSNTK